MNPFCDNMLVFVNQQKKNTEHDVNCSAYIMAHAVHCILQSQFKLLIDFNNKKKKHAEAGWLNTNNKKSMVDIFPQAIYKQINSLFTIYIPLR